MVTSFNEIAGVHYWEPDFSGMTEHGYARCGKLTSTGKSYTVTVHGDYPTYQGPAVPCALVSTHEDECRSYWIGFRSGFRDPELHPRDVDSEEVFADVIDYPLRPEQELRRQLQTKDSMRHPAKANIFMVEDLWRYVSLPGQLIVDFFGGTGTTGIAVRENRKVLLIELETPFIAIESDNNKILHRLYDKEFFIVQGDNRRILLGMKDIDHIIGSPPYAGAMTRKAITEDSAESDKALTGNMMVGEYTASPENLGIANKFMYNQRMTRLYQASYDALKPGGTMTVILADVTRDGKRVPLSRWLYTTCGRIGFQLLMHFRRYMPGTSYKAVHAARGIYVVTDEDIVIWRKPDA